MGSGAKHRQITPFGDIAVDRVIKRHQPLFEGEAIDERLQRRTRLTPRQHAVHLGRRRQRAAGADPGQHLAAGVVQHQHGAVFDIAAVQLGQLVLEQLGGITLQASVQAATLVSRALGAQDLARDMGRQLLAQRHAGRAQQSRLGLTGHGLAAQALQLEQAAGALAPGGCAGIGRAQQGGGQGALHRRQASRMLAEQHLRKRMDADQLAAKGHAVDIGLEDLRLGPAPFQLGCQPDLAQLLARASAAGRAGQTGVDQAGQLHGHR